MPPAAIGDEVLADLRGVQQADFNSDGSRLVVQLRDARIGLWDCATGSAVCPDLGRGRPTDFYAARSDRKVAFVAFRSGEAQLFDLTTGEPASPLFEVAALTGQFAQAVFSPDFRTVVVVDREHSVHIFDAQNGQRRIPPVRTVSQPSEANERHREVVFAAKGSACFVSDLDSSILRYNTKTWRTTGRAIRHVREEYSFGFTVSDDGKFLTTFDDEGEHGSRDLLQLWDAETARPLGKSLLGQDGVVGKFLTRPSRLLVTKGRLGSGVFQLPSLRKRFAIEEHDDVNGPLVRVSPDGRWIASVGSDRFLTLQDAITGERRARVNLGHRVGSIQFGPKADALFLELDRSPPNELTRSAFSVVRVRLPKLEVDGSIDGLEYVHRVVISRDGRRMLIVHGAWDHERIRLVDSNAMKSIEMPGA